MLLKIQVIGNIGNDCLVKVFNGKKAVNFSVAYNEKYVDKDAVVHENTTWINATLWRNDDTALIKYLKKGQLVYLEGTPSVKVYRDKNGDSKVDFSMNVDSIKLLGGKNDKPKDPSPENSENSSMQENLDAMKAQ
jgi:single-strand DNA-binding protein